MLPAYDILECRRMNAPSQLFRPFSNLVKIRLLDKEVEVPENNALLRGLQYLAQEDVSLGRFCWNEDCQLCRVSYDLGEGTLIRSALACKLQVQEKMRISDVSPEIKYCLRNLDLKAQRTAG
jgi:NADH dehydrogenase/NADH:ubiquinone oxidoreductase subunit G